MKNDLAVIFQTTWQHGVQFPLRHCSCPVFGISRHTDFIKISLFFVRLIFGQIWGQLQIRKRSPSSEPMGSFPGRAVKMLLLSNIGTSPSPSPILQIVDLSIGEHISQPTVFRTSRYCSLQNGFRLGR